MANLQLREAIAKEAARLMLRGTETDYVSARKRAAKWLARGRVEPFNLPGDAEIEAQLYALARLFEDGSRGTAAIQPAEPAREAASTPPPEDDYHPDAIPALRILLARLAKVSLDSREHPEGDALYHSLQVYELGLQERPYDEEFLLACLLHEVGRGIDRRNPLAATLKALRGLLTERTCFLIEHLPEASEFRRTGKISKALRRSEDFDDLVALAQCNAKGRVPGAKVGTADEALDYIFGLGDEWE